MNKDQQQKLENNTFYLPTAEELELEFTSLELSVAIDGHSSLGRE